VKLKIETLVILGIVIGAVCVKTAQAQEPCTGETIVLGGETAEAPIVVRTSCPCIAWSPSVDFTVHHYHLRVDGTLYASTTTDETQISVCLPAKDQAFGIDVRAVSVNNEPDSPASETTYVRWEDLICTQTVTVPPNADGTCP
jgi:hypothetical protein